MATAAVAGSIVWQPMPTTWLQATANTVSVVGSRFMPTRYSPSTCAAAGPTSATVASTVPMVRSTFASPSRYRLLKSSPTKVAVHSSASAGCGPIAAAFDGEETSNDECRRAKPRLISSA